jgi:hypothetical protein
VIHRSKQRANARKARNSALLVTILRNTAAHGSKQVNLLAVAVGKEGEACFGGVILPQGPIDPVKRHCICAHRTDTAQSSDGIAERRVCYLDPLNILRIKRSDQLTVKRADNSDVIG